MLSRIMEDIDFKDLNINLEEVDIDMSQEKAIQYKVRAVPTLVLVDGDEVVSTKVGMLSENDLVSWLKENSKAG